LKSVKYGDKSLYPSKIICVGRNYVEHIHELGNEIPENMVLFNKSNSAIATDVSYFEEDCRFEGELCFLIQDSKISAVGFGLDLTKAGLQNYLKSKGLPWERSKSFDGSAVFSEFVELDFDIKSFRFELYQNSKPVQEADYELMIYKPNEIIQEISSFMSFEDGDIVMSGTPKGVGNYKVGDEFEANIYSGKELILNWTTTVK
jgi:2-keto-4-pentenoate hydratase/2-oxohepta-3-ene-1,7-dioic acid hydratase in catechol pathway